MLMVIGWMEEGKWNEEDGRSKEAGVGREKAQVNQESAESES